MGCLHGRRKILVTGRWNNVSSGLRAEMLVRVVNSKEGMKDLRLSSEGNFAIFMWFVPRLVVGSS